MEKEIQVTPQYSISAEELIAERNNYIDCYELPTIMKERYKL